MLRYTLFRWNFNRPKSPSTSSASTPKLGSNAKAKILWVNFSGSIRFEPGQAASLLTGTLSLRMTDLNNSNLGICQAGCGCGCLQKCDADMTKVWDGSVELKDMRFYQGGVNYEECQQHVFDTVLSVAEELHSDMFKMSQTYMAIPINANIVDPERIIQMCLEKLRILGYTFSKSAISINRAPEAVNILMLDEHQRSAFQTWLNENLGLDANVGTSTTSSASPNTRMGR